MKKVLVVSPHFDDAILSAGQFLAGRPDADVVTVFGGYPIDRELLTEYDKKCGFTSSRDAVSVRRWEDDEALALLRANPIHWDFLDNQYPQQPYVNASNAQAISTQVLKQLEKKEYEFLLSPLGLGHPDHITVANAIRNLEFEGQIGIPVYYWEDLPLRVIEPETVQPRLKELKLEKLVSVGDGPMVDKIRALSCYRSQIGTGILNPYVMYVPERFWE